MQRVFPLVISTLQDWRLQRLYVSPVSREERKDKTEYLTGKGYKARIISQKVDVSKSNQVEEWIQYTIAEFKHLDGAANVAGIAGGTGTTTCATMVPIPLNSLFLVISLKLTIYRWIKTGMP